MGTNKLILIVCTANICRSPMIAGLLQKRLRETGLDRRVRVQSAGVLAVDGEPISPYTVEVLAEVGIDVSGQTARNLRYRDIQQADMILVTEENHRRSIFNRSPENLHKVFLLSELVGEHEDLADPYGQGRAAYAATRAEIDRILHTGWDGLMARLQIHSHDDPPPRRHR